MISGGILLSSPFCTTSLASCICLEPPWIFLALTCFLQLTVDSIIEPKRGACSHSLRSFRRSRETFLQVKKRKKEEKHSFSSLTFYFLFSFIQQIIFCACYVPSFVLRIDWGLKGNQDTVPSSRIYSLEGEGRHANRVIGKLQVPCSMFVQGPVRHKEGMDSHY